MALLIAVKTNFKTRTLSRDEEDCFIVESQFIRMPNDTKCIWSLKSIQNIYRNSKSREKKIAALKKEIDTVGDLNSSLLVVDRTWGCGRFD